MTPKSGCNGKEEGRGQKNRRASRAIVSSPSCSARPTHLLWLRHWPAHSTPSSQQAHNKHKHCHVFIAGIIDNRELTYNINLLDLPLKYGNIHFHFEHEVARG